MPRALQPPADLASAASRPVRLGATHPNGIAPGIYALVDRGAMLRPALLPAMHGRVELRFEADLEPVRIEFGAEEALVEDGAWDRTDVVIAGPLPDVVALTTVPLVAGMPNPVARRGRVALAGIARGRIRISGRRALARQLLQLLRV